MSSFARYMTKDGTPPKAQIQTKSTRPFPAARRYPDNRPSRMEVVVRRDFAALATATALLLAAGPAFAQAGSALPDLPIPCSAFARTTGGGWTVTAPAMLDFNGMLISFIVGTHLAPGSSQHGIAIPVILDRECGNRSGALFRP
jgi:hypothetical protein